MDEEGLPNEEVQMLGQKLFLNLFCMYFHGAPHVTTHAAFYRK